MNFVLCIDNAKEGMYPILSEYLVLQYNFKSISPKSAPRLALLSLLFFLSTNKSKCKLRSETGKFFSLLKIAVCSPLEGSNFKPIFSAQNVKYGF